MTISAPKRQFQQKIEWARRRKSSKEDNRYVIDLLWKKDLHMLPENFPLAERQLELLERSLSKNERKAKMYNHAKEEYIENGWARPLTEGELKHNVKPVYYLVCTDQTSQAPHFEWSSTLPANIRASLSLHFFAKDLVSLEIYWATVNFTVKNPHLNRKFTKRTIRLKMSQIYDPLELASAVAIKARVALQDIWLSKQFNWDDPLPEDMKELWRDLFADIEAKGREFCEMS